jgi:lipoprotein-releasing system permease protein
LPAGAYGLRLRESRGVGCNTRGVRASSPTVIRRSFSLFLALRYLKPKRTFLSVITLISVLGVTLGIAVLIIVISVMTGFDQELRRKVLGFDAQLMITNDAVMYDWRELADEIRQTPGVLAAAPFMQGPVIVEFHNKRLAPKIRGIDLEEESKVTDIRKAVVEGEPDLTGDTALIGRELAEDLGIGVGDVLTVYSPKNMERLSEEMKKAENDPDTSARIGDLTELVAPAELTVTGIFESGRFVYDSEFILVPLHIGQELYELGDGLHGISVKTNDPYNVDAVRDAMRDILVPPLHGITWMEMNSQLFDAIHMERNVMFFLLLFIVIVAAFGVMNTLITVTVQKTREIGIMKALGANTAQIVWVFLAQGMVVGFFGNLAGLAMGTALVRYRNEFRAWLSDTFHITVFPARVYQFQEIPAQIVPHDVAIICISAFVICSIAALIPAYFAARLDPVKALRFD